MNTLPLKKIELSNLIFNFNSKQIEKLISFVETNNLISEKSNCVTLAGIWSDINFDAIYLDNEIRNLRNNITKNLDNIQL